MNNDSEHGLTAKLALENLRNSCMEYCEDYDWDENLYGGYYPVSDDILDDWCAPINKLIEKDAAKALITIRGRTVCPVCKSTKITQKELQFLGNYKFCPQCGQKLKN